jgi:hypothetical protein
MAPSSPPHVHHPGVPQVLCRQHIRVPDARGSVRHRRRQGHAAGRRLVGKLHLQRSRREEALIMSSLCCLEVLHGLPDLVVVEEVLHDGEEAGELLDGKGADEARAAAGDGVVQEQLDLALVVLAPRLVHLLRDLVDLLPEEALHVHRLLALAQLWHGPEAGDHARRLGHTTGCDSPSPYTTTHASTSHSVASSRAFFIRPWCRFLNVARRAEPLAILCRVTLFRAIWRPADRSIQGKLLVCVGTGSKGVRGPLVL